jgi:DNA polymerase-4
MQRIILHVDMDAFFAAVEIRDDPRLRGKPVIIGGSNRRGVVSTASYEARPYGVHSALPMAQALQLCPKAIVLPPRISHYSEVSTQIMDVLDNFSPSVQPLSLDEAFLDMTGSEGLFGTPDDMARAIKEGVFEATRLRCSVGIGCNKFLAKLASDLDKPDGITWVPFGKEAAFIAPLAVRKLWGVGPKAADRLERLGLHKIGDIAAADPNWLIERLGANYGRHLFALANAQDERPVTSGGGRKSVGSEVTLDDDVRGRSQVEPILRRQCLRVAQHLRAAHLKARGLRVKVRYSLGFRLKTRQAVLPLPCDESGTLIEKAFELLERFDLDPPIRLVGAAGYDLEDADHTRQLDLFAQKKSDSRSKLEHTVDEIRDRYGNKIGFGRSDS